MGTSGLNNLQTRRGTAVKKRPSFNLLLFNFELGVSRWFTDYSHRRYIVIERWPQLKEGRSRERRTKLGLDDSHVLLLINGWTKGDLFVHFRKFTLTTTITFTSSATRHLRCAKIRFSHC